MTREIEDTCCLVAMFAIDDQFLFVFEGTLQALFLQQHLDRAVAVAVIQKLLRKMRYDDSTELILFDLILNLFKCMAIV